MAALPALVSTFADQLLIVGSIANIVVVGAAARKGITAEWLAPSIRWNGRLRRCPDVTPRAAGSTVPAITV